jgi:hypothetical protein
MHQLGKEESGSSLPLSGTLELPSDRPTGAHSAELAQPPLPSTAGCVRWVMAMGAYTYTTYQQPRPCFNRELVYAKSSTSRWIASRSRS